jgi:hypothetical protein
MTTQLYVTDWAPNGTNDLLVVRDGQIVDCLPEATFGIDLRKTKDNAWVFDGFDWLVAPGTVDSLDASVVGRVSMAQVSEALAVSPLLSRTEAEARALAFLNQHGLI